MACKRFTLAACTVRRDGLRPVKLRTAEGFTDMVVDAILRVNATDRRSLSSTSEWSSENLTLILERRTLRNPFKFIPGRDPSCSAKAREIFWDSLLRPGHLSRFDTTPRLHCKFCFKQNLLRVLQIEGGTLLYKDGLQSKISSASHSAP